MVNVRMSESDLLAEFPWRHRVNARHDVTFCYGRYSTARRHRSLVTVIVDNTATATATAEPAAR